MTSREEGFTSDQVAAAVRAFSAARPTALGGGAPIRDALLEALEAARLAGEPQEVIVDRLLGRRPYLPPSVVAYVERLEAALGRRGT